MIYAGYDAREAIGYHVFAQSLIDTSPGVGILPLVNLAPQGDGSNAFTYSRFAIPELQRSGPALYVDGSDMLLRVDVQELLDLFDPRYAVQVVKHDYKTRYPRKYVGTPMECDNHDYPRKNWSSVILWNCDHPANRQRDLFERDGAYLHRFGWLEDHEIGALPKEWNWLADEYGANLDAKLLHWTTGIPGLLRYYRNAPHAGEWLAVRDRVLAGSHS